MRLLDEHWIAYPEFVAGDLGWLERFKLRRLGRPAIRYLDVILARATAEQGSILQRAALTPGGFVLVVPGGGTGHPGAHDAAAEFLAAANSLAESDLVVYVGPPGSANPRLRSVGSLPQAELAELMRAARLVVTNGGSTLLQAIACGCACIAVPIAQDQPQRIARCAAAGLAVPAELAAAGILKAAAKLLRDEPARAALAQRASALKLANGIEVALHALAHLADTR
jgi:UDP:flavonoid glycosyltransferase YjiC (YdhE family)